MSRENTEGEKVKKIAEFRTLLEKRIREMETELEGMRVLLGFMNTALLEKGFKRAEMVKPASTILPETAAPSVVEYKRSVPLKTATGDLLANLYVEENSMRVVLAEEKDFNINTPPFMSFLVERVLVKMQEKDREAAGTGEIAPEKILSYNIVREGDVVREITIQNIRSERLKELKSTIRWTLEKMYEKMKTGS
ncbi:MAG: hypothetical protein JSV12_07705 [Candidatus Bathyarchaeota archaeon]|nr:MAG: hypothetical protein JSV12_07705 [Candidatus Bathyarchaeota archaeon]